MDIYKRFIGEGDPRVIHLPFMKAPTHVLGIMLLYLIAVRRGPQIMENYKPFKLKGVLLIYNAILVLLSVYIFKEALITAYLANYNLNCNLVDYSIDPLALRMANAMWWFFISKAIELLDTIFIILRKKSDQISFLHVYHHCTMLCFCWTGARYFPGGEAAFPMVLNCFVHVFMYSYYGLAAFGERLKPYLWWKRYLTQLQLLQFATGLLHLINLQYHNCQYPRFLKIVATMYVITLVILFGNFYFQTYIMKRTSKRNLQKPIKED